MQNFINDLIRTVEEVDGREYTFRRSHTFTHAHPVSNEDPQRTVQMFIDLVQRHEQSFYYFVYKVHAKGDGLFDNLMHWIELFITVVREGLGEPISLEFLLPHTGQERQEILEEVDKVALYHYKLKVLHEDKVRRRFGRAQGQNEADAEDEATQTLLDNAVNEISLGGLVRTDAGDVDAESDTEEESSEYETCSSNEDTDSSEEESEEGESEVSSAEAHFPVQRSPRNPRIRPVATVSPVAVDVTQPESQPPQGRRRSLSLKRIRSMGSLSNLRRSHETPPPVPSLPKELKSPTPLPSSSSTVHPPARSTDAKFLRPRASMADVRRPRSSPQPPLSSEPPRVTKEKKKKKREPLNPPELVHIPKLLPVFVEMVRCFVNLALDVANPSLDARTFTTPMK